MQSRHNVPQHLSSTTQSIQNDAQNYVKYVKIGKLVSVSLLAMTMSLTGCQTIKKITGSHKKTVETAKYSEADYYQTAMTDISKQRYIRASNNLKELRTFFPTGQYAQQALLELMYVEYQQANYEDAIASARQFISLYPSSPQADYAYYVLGVSNMAGTSSKIDLFKVDQSARDTAYYRLAFASFAELIRKYPNSIYAADAAQRMTYIYNQFAKHELHVARWYIERKAYVAAANRAKWIFQYYPRSQSVPESIATLAYSYQQLGMTDLANEYKTLLQINYPNWLTATGEVKLEHKSKYSLLGSQLVNKLTLGKLGRAGNKPESDAAYSQYKGQTKTQLIRGASQLRLPVRSQPSAQPAQR